MKRTCIFGVVAGLLLVATEPGRLYAQQKTTAPGAAAVEIGAESHHQLLLENEYARVWRVEIPPHEATAVHHHAHDYLLVALGPTDIVNEVAGKAPVEVRQHPGEVGFAQGGFSHRAINKADTPFRNITVELLKPARGGAARPASREERALDIGHGSVTDTVYEDPRVRVQEVEIAAGAMLEKHHHAIPHLLVPITDIELHSLNEGKPDSMVRLKSGEVLWVPAGGTHALMNVGKQQAEYITVEFKP